jgi:hypothetical protein
MHDTKGTRKMLLVPLSLLEDWKLEHKDQDLRGRWLIDEEGQRIAKIEEMLVDVYRGRVVAVRMKDGDEYPLNQLDIRDGQVHILRECAMVA